MVVLIIYDMTDDNESMLPDLQAYTHGRAVAAGYEHNLKA